MTFEKMKIWHRVLSSDEITRVFNGQEIKCGCFRCRELEKQ